MLGVGGEQVIHSSGAYHGGNFETETIHAAPWADRPGGTRDPSMRNIGIFCSAPLLSPRVVEFRLLHGGADLRIKYCCLVASRHEAIQPPATDLTPPGMNSDSSASLSRPR